MHTEDNPIETGWEQKRQELRAHARLLIAYSNLVEAQTDGERHGAGMALMAIQIAAEYKKRHPEAELPPFQEIFLGGQMHDGKKSDHLDAINSTSALTLEQRKELEEHPLKAEQELLEDKLIPKAVAIAVGEHHERMDGSGYPRHKRGEEISLLGRIFAIADVWDALRNRGDDIADRLNGFRKYYKTKWNDGDIQNFFQMNAGILFDEELAEILLSHYTRFTTNYAQTIKQENRFYWGEGGQPVFAEKGISASTE